MRLFAEGNVDFALADLTQAEYDGYYLGYANRALWPVFHYRVDLAHFDEAEFAAYEAVNRRFAPPARPVRPRRTTPSGCTTTTSCSWARSCAPPAGRAAWASSCTSPSRRPRSSPRCPSTSASPAASAPSTSSASRPSATPRTSAAISSRVAGGAVLDDGRHPGLRPDACAPRPSPSASTPTTSPRQAEGEEGRAAAARLGRIIDNRALVIGVDRMDYSKGLPQRMEAFGRMLDDHEELRGSVSFLQIAPALARGGRRLPGAARGARPPRRPHQRRLCRPRLDADPLPRPQLSTAARSAASTAWPASASSRRSTTA